MDTPCAVCGSIYHHALCPVPRIAADPNRALTPEVAMSDWADLLLEDPSRDRATEILGMVLNWGTRPLVGRVSALETHIADLHENFSTQLAAAKAADRG